LSSSARRKVCIVLVDRANYGRLKPVMRSVAAHPQLELQVIATGSMVLERFGLPVQVVANDGFPIDAEVYMELEGSTPATMAKSVGFGIVEFSGAFQRLQPDVVLLIGDRYEALAAAVAAAYMNLCIVHIQGGEVSGSIDESARHAISKFAHYHLPSTRRSADYLIRMGEHPRTILGIGCPSSDLARHLDRTLKPEVLLQSGSGTTIDVSKPFLLTVFHPTTTEFGHEWRQMEEVLRALDRLAMPCVLLWPNIDAGADHISKAIRVFRTDNKPKWLRTMTNLPPDDYLTVLANAACAVGNSSSFIRDASYFGTPVVLVGNRQDGRETSSNVTRTQPYASDIEACIRRQVTHGKYEPSTLYGDGHVSERICSAVCSLELYAQKQLHYVNGSAVAAVAAD
jgi:UDP-hydrolysing UDP-N-acetyl-D-glucosamine 2-epimerase